MSKVTRIVSFLIVLLALFVRIYRVAAIPPSLSWDEVSIGYNAYSILKTGTDEHGRFLPLDTFVAYGDYKPPLPIYLTIPSVALLGLSEFAVRLPSIVAGVVTVFVVFLMIRELFGFSGVGETLGLLTSFLLAISPWHIQLSRAAFEANIALLCIVSGVYFVLVSRRFGRIRYISFLPFVAAVYTFNSARYFAPVLVVALLYYCRKTLGRYKKELFLGVIIAVLALLPIAGHLVSKEARLRFNEVNIFTDSSIVTIANARMAVDGSAWWSDMLHNRRIGYARSYLMHFFDNLEPWFLFVRGDGNPKFSLQDVGQLYLIEAPFLILGILYLLRDYRGIAGFLLFWIAAAIMPAATARETPHALRIENSIIPWYIFISYGIQSALRNISKEKNRWVAMGIGILYVASFSYFWHNYMQHYGTEYSGEWQYGYREAIAVIQPLKQNYSRIVMTENIGRPYMYVLFYEHRDPKQLQNQITATFDAAGFYNVTGLGQYTFVKELNSFEQNVLYVLPPAQVPPKARIVSTIHLLNGDPALVIFDI